ncbi:hypothetical protein [Streptomyces sp. NBC_01465]|uniref:hypothetical protein n=1 Tax=Streptomyces sp. NBC_01465 TaxID=2903878 RepID=UPI002E3231CB|nr:hypothetical protein [Streptomyces sp. NBC_01465]
MSEIVETTVHEAYAFACMRCGYGWEQAYEIEHHVDASGHAFVMYKAGGERVPSPLSTPSCINCGGHVVRIMRSGQVSTVQGLMHPQKKTSKLAEPVTDETSATATEETAPEPHHHWHLSDLLHPFHRK